VAEKVTCLICGIPFSPHSLIFEKFEKSTAVPDMAPEPEYKSFRCPVTSFRVHQRKCDSARIKSRQSNLISCDRHKTLSTCLHSSNLYFTSPQQAELHTQPTPYKPTINPGSTKHLNQLSPDRPTSHALFLVRRGPGSLPKRRREHKLE
jgi:hypothetical protein